MKAEVARAVVRPLVRMDELTEAADLLAAIWGYPARSSSGATGYWPAG